MLYDEEENMAFRLVVCPGCGWPHLLICNDELIENFFCCNDSVCEKEFEEAESDINFWNKYEV